MSEKTFLTKIKQAKALIRDTLNEFVNKRVGLLYSFHLVRILWSYFTFAVKSIQIKYKSVFSSFRYWIR